MKKVSKKKFFISKKKNKIKIKRTILKNREGKNEKSRIEEWMDRRVRQKKLLRQVYTMEHPVYSQKEFFTLILFVRLCC
jgi:hypothetical protein